MIRMDAFSRKNLLAVVSLFALMLLRTAIASAGAPNGPADPNPIQRATYNAPAEFATLNQPQKANEPMPFGEAGRDSNSSAISRGSHRDMPATTSSAPAVLSMFGSLAVVIGLFLGLVWLLRRGSPKSIRLLSSDVVELLGRSPLAGRQQMHVIRFGNRLLLVAVSPDGAETLAEITEPVEVDRIAGLCQQSQPNSATQAFRQVFGQMTSLRRPSRLDADGSLNSADASPSDSARGGAISVSVRKPVAARLEEDNDV